MIASMDSPLTQPQESKPLRTEIRESTLTYVLGAFGLVAGLAWNDAIQSLIAYIFPRPENTLPAKFLYAIIVSVVVVIVSVYLARLFRRFHTS